MWLLRQLALLKLVCMKTYNYVKGRCAKKTTGSNIFMRNYNQNNFELDCFNVSRTLIYFMISFEK